MFDFDKFMNDIKKDSVNGYWFDVEFLNSNELKDFYTKWKADKEQSIRSKQESAEKEKRRLLWEQLQKEFGNESS
jgi:hypothetical protein